MTAVRTARSLELAREIITTDKPEPFVDDSEFLDENGIHILDAKITRAHYEGMENQ